MKIFSIITAMAEEAELIIKKYALKKDKTLQNITTFVGDYKKNEIVLVLTGLGKIQASIGTTFLLENYKVDYLVNIGLAGNVSDKNIKIGDIVILDRCFQHDFSISFPGDHDLYARQSIMIDNMIKDIDIDRDFDIIHGCINLTGDQFIEDTKTIKGLKERFSPDTVDMEAYAILSVAREYNKLDKCLVIKAISDSATEDAKDNLFKNITLAMNNSIKVLDYFLTN
ncbi:5'-methylthioadenosine/S-adenosylhomocysteine nucleosidase [Candidatus Gracilibacteria bacterium]|nr:5'-methylthioadenosine/S-adenosylhomocysteine nucleosidase [Candidatus Gracilibacteria bacterium]